MEEPSSNDDQKRWHKGKEKEFVEISKEEER